MRRRTIFIVVAVTALGGVGIAASLPGDSLAVPALAALPLSSTALPFDRDDPSLTRIGALRFMGALHIHSSNRRFGGISGLRAGRGQRMLAESDTGNWIAFDTMERDGRLTGVANGVIAPILRPDGLAALTKQDGDAEALEWDPATGDASITYEQDHRIVHFTGIDADRPETLRQRPVSTERLAGMAGWRLNGGGEATAAMPGGARIVIREDPAADDRTHDALLTIGGVTRALTVTAPAGFSPTDAIALDDHRLLILNRNFGIAAQQAALTLVDLAPALAGRAAALVPVELARWQPPLTVDNMEALALRRDGKRVFLYIASDDNLSSLQRTLLMKFELVLR